MDHWEKFVTLSLNLVMAMLLITAFTYVVQQGNNMQKFNMRKVDAIETIRGNAEQEKWEKKDCYKVVGYSLMEDALDAGYKIKIVSKKDNQFTNPHILYEMPEDKKERNGYNVKDLIAKVLLYNEEYNIEGVHKETKKFFDIDCEYDEVGEVTSVLFAMDVK